MQQKTRGSQEPVIAHLVSISLLNFIEKFQLNHYFFHLVKFLLIVMAAIFDGANCISGVMVNMLISSAVDCGFESGKTKDYKIGICCFCANHAALRRKNKNWLARNQDNVSEWATCLSVDCCFSELAL